MHLLGTILSVNFLEKGKAECFRIFQGSSKFHSTFWNTWKWLEYIWWTFNKTGRICMTYLNEVTYLWNITANIRMETKLLIFQLFVFLISSTWEEGKFFCRYLEKMLWSKFWSSKHSRSWIGPKSEHMMD